MSNLLDLVKDQFSDEITGQLGGMLGMDKGAAGSALSKAIPSVLSGVIDKGSTESGASELIDTINQNNLGADTLSGLGGIFGNQGKMDSFLNMGSGLVSSLFGDNKAGLISKLSSLVGLDSGGTGKLLSFIAPVVMGSVGKMFRSQNMDASGLANMLGSQKSMISKLVPSGLSGLTSIKAPKIESVSTPNVSAPKAKSGGAGWAKWLILAAALLGLLWVWNKWGKSAAGDAADTVKDKTEQVAEGARDVAGDAVDATKDAGSEVAQTAKNAAAGVSSYAESVTDLFSSEDRVGQAFRISKMDFHPEDHRLTDYSKNEVDGLVNAIKNDADAIMQIRVHTADGANAKENMNLSNKRANVVKDMFVTLLGDSKAQVTYKGMGNRESDKASENVVEAVVIR